MHSCKLITNSRTKKVVCHCAEVVKNFRCYTTDCVLGNVIWWIENSPQKVIEAQKTGQTSPDPLLLGGVWAQG